MNRLIDHAINLGVTVAAVALNTVAELWSPTPYDRVERAYNDLLDAAEDACWRMVGVDHQGSSPKPSVDCTCYCSVCLDGAHCGTTRCDKTSTPPSTSDGEGPDGDCDIPPSPSSGRPTSSIDWDLSHIPHADERLVQITVPIRDYAPTNSPAAVQPKPAVGLTWVDWATPAITDVLANHYCVYREDEAMYYCHSADGFANPHATFGDSQAWREHVAPLIAERIERASKPQK